MLIFYYFHVSGEKNREGVLSAPFSIKARALIHAALSRTELNAATLGKDRDYILKKTPQLLREMIQCCVNTIVAMRHQGDYDWNDWCFYYVSCCLDDVRILNVWLFALNYNFFNTSSPEHPFSRIPPSPSSPHICSHIWSFNLLPIKVVATTLLD